MTDADKAILDTIVRLADQASIEINPHVLDDKPELLDLIPSDREVFVTHLPGKNFADTIKTCERVALKGAIPVAHIGSRSVPCLDTLAQWLKQLCSDTPTQRLLIIGGGSDKPVGTVLQSMDILTSGVLDDWPISHLFLAAHPEGNLFASDQDDIQILTDKQNWVSQQKRIVECVTQFGFDIDLILQWEKRIRCQHQINLPIRLGLPGKASMKSLLHFAKLCGVKNSLSFLRKRAKNVADLLRKQGPENQLPPLAHYLDQERACLFSGIHLFPLGGFKTSVLWLKMLQDQHFDLKNGQLFFRSEPS